MGVNRQQTEQELQKLRRLVDKDQLRVRRLFTFGSPISMQGYRSDAVVEQFAERRRLDPMDYGLTQNPADFGALHMPRWINVWDKDDPISCPVEPLMEHPAVRDAYVDVSAWVRAPHESYWDHEEVHRVFAEAWEGCVTYGVRAVVAMA